MIPACRLRSSSHSARSASSRRSAFSKRTALLSSGRALDILLVLVRQAGKVVTKEELLSEVWSNIAVHDSTLHVHIASLRKALGDGQSGARYVANVSGRGYC